MVNSVLCPPFFQCPLVIFGSDRSSRCHNVHPSICAGQSCLEQSIFIFLGLRAIRALREKSESNQRAIRVLKSESYSRSLKYCVLLFVQVGISVVKDAAARTRDAVKLKDQGGNPVQDPSYFANNALIVTFQIIYQIYYTTMSNSVLTPQYFDVIKKTKVVQH